ncbi:MAG TPA: DUF4214 domain-containing protein, partial [Pirellulales bacterium]|nr:DUF4214 domain-containing protein [Pirellulales bacterium]
GTPTSNASIALNAGIFTVSGTHTYAEEGGKSPVLTITHDSSAAVTTTASLTVSDPAVVAVPATLTAVESAAGTFNVATFTDPAGAEAIGNYRATIDWGDGTPTSNASIALNAGVFTASGTHTYAEEGAKSPVLTITHDSAPPLTVDAMAIVADAPLLGVTAIIVAGTTVSGTVANFTDADASDATGDYSATIDWGDGQTGPGNVVAGTSAGQFHVMGNHSYADNRSHTIAITVRHGTDQPLVVTSAEPGETFNLLGNFGLVEDTYVNGSGTVTVAADNGVLKNDSAPSALTVTSGTVAGANGGSFVFHADGSFTYTPPASFPGFDDAQYAAADAQGDHGTATVTVLSQIGGVVWKFYEQVLNRDPDYGGLKYWIGDFVNGGKTGDIAAGFFESDELLNTILGGYYLQYLGRVLDQQGLDYWKAVWHATGGPEGIKAGFADSPEFNKNAGNAKGDNPVGWLTALYQRILNRAPDAQGLQYWEEQLAGGISEYNVALGFFDSFEAFKNDVTGWFNEYLERAPTDAELVQYANEMLGGKTDRDIEQEITNLPEYGANPPSSPERTAVRLPDYHPRLASTSGQQQVAVAARDAVFSRLGS